MAELPLLTFAAKQRSEAAQKNGTPPAEKRTVQERSRITRDMIERRLYQPQLDILAGMEADKVIRQAKEQCRRKLRRRGIFRAMTLDDLMPFVGQILKTKGVKQHRHTR